MKDYYISWVAAPGEDGTAVVPAASPQQAWAKFIEDNPNFVDAEGDVYATIYDRAYDDRFTGATIPKWEAGISPSDDKPFFNRIT